MGYYPKELAMDLWMWRIKVNGVPYVVASWGLN